MREENDSAGGSVLVKGKKRSGLLFMLGLALIGLGLAFCLLLLRGYLAAAAYDDWQPTPALVVASWIEPVPQPGSDPMRYRLRVRYRYEIAGETYVSTRVREIESNTRQRAKLERLQERFRSGEEATCFVNPRHPEEAILLRPTKAPGYTVWYPALFVLGGAGMCIRALRRRHR